MNELIAAFTPEQAEQITGVSRKRLSEWYRKGLLTPRYVDDGWLGVKYLYSFRDLVTLRTLLVLRETYNIPLEQLREVNEFFQQHSNDPWAALTLYVFGREVLFDEPTLRVRLAAAQSGQEAIPFPIAPVIDWARENIHPFVERTPDEIGYLVRRGRRLYIAGTRIPADAVWDYLDNGYTEEDVLRSYSTLTLEDVQAVRDSRHAKHAKRSA
jgi:uncharacterized protein (DUF433 family)